MFEKYLVLHSKREKGKREEREKQGNKKGPMGSLLQALVGCWGGCDTQ